jgi:hypothetical protein
MAADLSKLVATILVVAGSTIVAAAVGIIGEALINPHGGWYKRLNSEKKVEALRNLVSVYASVNRTVYKRCGLIHSHIHAYELCCIPSEVCRECIQDVRGRVFLCPVHRQNAWMLDAHRTCMT